MNLKMKSDAFFNSFYSNHVILYIGQESNDDEIKESLSKCAWSAVITTRRDAEFSTFFSNDERVPFDLSSREEMPAKLLNRTKLPIIRLLGIDGENDDEDELSWLTTQAPDPINKANKILEILPEILDHVNPMVITGINSEIDWEILGRSLLKILFTKTTDGSISIWGLPEELTVVNPSAYSLLKQVAEKKNFALNVEALSDIIHTRDNELNQLVIETADFPEYSNDIYYHGRIPVSISQSDLLLFKNVGTLLTERTIHKIRPMGRVASRKWFSNFLESSAFLGPQWYGYLPQSTFYVKRSFEDALVQLVRKMLDGRDLNGSSTQNRPIILAGHPGSSKSITLGALAYRIYNEKTNPVIYISKDSFLNTNIGTEFDELDEALRFLENNSVADTKILVIWDNSAYRAGVERAKNLLEKLQNRGRRFVLVCSSYTIHSRKDEKDGGFCYHSENNIGKFKPCSSEYAQIFDRSGCYFVKATRQMTEKEKFDFWQRVKEYSGINDTIISKFAKKLSTENRNEIFDFYYLLISVLRDNLEKGLQSEQSKVYPYVKKELKKAIGEVYSSSVAKAQTSPIYQALLSAGLDPKDYIANQNTSDTSSEDELEQKLDTFNLCVALFSRFKLSVPYGLAYTLLVGENQSDQYSESSRNLYKVVTTEIPWIHYGEDINGDFSFSFRNSLEADIFLSNHDFTGEHQIELLCKIIDIYGSGYRKNRLLDEVFTENLQVLLRLMGPNSGYTPFLSRRTEEHLSILRKLNVLIDQIKKLRTEYGVPDIDAGFASIIVTFTREYYGSIWNTLYSSINLDNKRWEYDISHFSPEAYEFRIKQLTSAIALAEESIEELEQRKYNYNNNSAFHQHLLNQCYSLAVEIAQCNMRLEDVVDEYLTCCDALNYPPKKDLINRKLNYRLLYSQLYPVISNNPTNGYAYNTLFKAFERMYERENLSETKKLQYLSEIMELVETCETLDSEIINRGSHGSDELTDHINRIKDLSTGFQITLQSICRHLSGYPAENDTEQLCFDLYDEMLEANNAAAITFICQKELRIPRGTRYLNTDQLLRCRSVYNFMFSPDNFECVNSNTYALTMLIRVCWMLYNETTLTNYPECQLTKLHYDQWLEIYRLCTRYNEIADTNKQPLIMLIYALSSLQVSNLTDDGYHKALDILASLDENKFYQKRMWTPFMLCNADGKPYNFTGTVITSTGKSNFMRVNGIPLHLKNNVGVRFHQQNLGRKSKLPERNQVFSELEIGIGYTGFSVYTQIGRKEKEVRS